MGEKVVVFRDNQELQAADLINQQDWQTEALDHVVVDTIEDAKAYSGFAVTKATQTTVQVASGRMYNAGAVYARDETVTLDFYNDLPVTTKRQFAIVVWGQTVNSDIQPRNFVVDADTGAAQPQSVAMETARYCNVEYVRGIESSDPQIPSTDANVVCVAYVLCDTTGIVSVTQNLATQVNNLADVSDRVSSMENWRAVLTGAVDTLRTDLANLAKQLLLYTPLVDHLRLVDVVNELYTKVFRPGPYIWYGTDNFLDEELSDPDATEGGTYSALINEGLRFPGGGTGATTTLQLLNPTDPYVQVDDGFMLPKPSGSRVRLDCSFPDHPWVEDRILQYVFWNFSCRHLKHSRWRHCVGRRYKPSPPSLVWWHQAKNDPVTRILSFISENWEQTLWRDIANHSVDEDSPDWPRHGCDRDEFHWRDWVHLPYWSHDYDDQSESGQHISQSFLNAQDGWLTSVTVYLMKAYYQPLTLILSGCDSQGEPDHTNQSLTRVSLDAEAIEDCVGEPEYAGDIEQIELAFFGLLRHVTAVPIYVYPCRIPITPTFLRAGQRYSLHLVSTYDHTFAVSNRFECYQAHQGHFWHSNGTALVLWPGNTTPKSLRFKLHYATWGRWGASPTTGGGLRYEINLQPLQLAGGIGAIEVLTRSIIPEACDVSYQVQIGGAWKAFAGGTNAPNFSTNPALLPFRVVMTGTTDLMPGISLTPSQVTLAGGEALSFHHISSLITLGTPSGHVKVIGKLYGFDDAHHTCVAKIYHGSAVEKTADVTEDETLEDYSLQRTWTFNIESPTIDDFLVTMDGTHDGVGDNFFVAQEIRFATA